MRVYTPQTIPKALNEKQESLRSNITPSSLVGNAMVVALVDNEIGSTMSEEQLCSHYAKSLNLYKQAHKIVSGALQESRTDPSPHGAGMRAVREYLDLEMTRTGNQVGCASTVSAKTDDRQLSVAAPENSPASSKINLPGTGLSTADHDTLAEIMLRVQQADLRSKAPKN